MSGTVLSPGTRVLIHGEVEWPDGTTGTVAEWPKGIRDLIGENFGSDEPRTLVSPKGVMLSYWIRFDEPTDDGSGDGPYRGAEVAGTYLSELGTSPNAS